jgi:hypothetical protein
MDKVTPQDVEDFYNRLYHEESQQMDRGKHWQITLPHSTEPVLVDKSDPSARMEIILMGILEELRRMRETMLNIAERD